MTDNFDLKGKARELPECPNYMAHPQAVWFNEHWRLIIIKLHADLDVAIAERDKWRKMAEELFDLLNTHRNSNYCELADKEEDELCARFDAMLGDKPEGE